MKKAIRRHYLALIKRHINQEIDLINTQYGDTGRYYFKNPEALKTLREKAIRYAYRNDGRYVRTKLARGGSGYICGCEYCISNWTYSTQREIARFEEEEKDYFPDACYLDDNTYFNYPDPYDYGWWAWDEDCEEGWWRAWREKNGYDQEDDWEFCYERRCFYRMTYSLDEVL